MYLADQLMRSSVTYQGQGHTFQDQVQIKFNCESLEQFLAHLIESIRCAISVEQLDFQRADARADAREPIIG